MLRCAGTIPPEAKKLLGQRFNALKTHNVYTIPVQSGKPTRLTFGAIMTLRRAAHFAR